MALWAIPLSAVLLTILLPARLAAADLSGREAPGRFLATCEDLGGFCFADACGRDQIEAAQGCRAACPSAVVLSVVPAACAIPEGRLVPVLRRRG